MAVFISHFKHPFTFRTMIQSFMMQRGLHYSRLSSNVLLPHRFSSSPRPLLRTPPTATFNASKSFGVRSTSERHDLLFSEGATPPMFTPNKREPISSEEISDREWQIRTGQFGMLLLGSHSDSTASPLYNHHLCLIVFDSAAIQAAPSTSCRRHSLTSLTLALCQAWTPQRYRLLLIPEKCIYWR